MNWIRIEGDPGLTGSGWRGSGLSGRFSRSQPTHFGPHFLKTFRGPCRSYPIRSGPGRSNPGASGALRGPSRALVNTHLGQRGLVDLQTVKRGRLGVDQPEKNCQLAAMVGEVAEDRVRNHDVARLLLHSLAP